MRGTGTYAGVMVLLLERFQLVQDVGSDDLIEVGVVCKFLGSDDEKSPQSLARCGLGVILWTRRDSNPRPNKHPKSFLQV